MKQMMWVGASCTVCKHTLKLGKTEIEPNTPPSLLHAQLRQEGWPESTTEDCNHEKCKSKTFVSLNTVFLLGQVAHPSALKNHHDS